MSERYEIIKEKELTDIWYKDFPIELNKTRLLYDNQTGNVLIQFKLTNVCTKIINTVYLKINCYDVSKTVVDSVEEHVIPMLSVKQNESFGDKAPAVSKDRRTADVNVIITKVVFSDGSVWENGNNFRPIQVHAPEEITFAPHIASRFKSVSGHLPNIKYMFREYDGYWRCTCGRINYQNADICSCCACKREELRNLFSEEYLKELIYQNAKNKMNSDTESEYMTAINILNTIKDYKDSEQLIEECNVGRKECIYKSAVSLIEEDNTFSYESAKKLLIKITDWRNSKELIEDCDTRIQEIHNEAEKQKEIQRVAKEKAKKKAKRKAMIICSVVVAVIIGIVLFVILGIPALKRNNAEKLLSEGRYDEGYAIIMELDGQEGVNSHKYERAKVHLNNKELDKAIEIFTELGTYSDSKEQLTKCKYDKAVSLMENENYDEATVTFSEINSYLDSENLLKECKYQSALILFNDKKYDEAIVKFDLLYDYKKSKEMSIECRYMKGNELINSQKYTDAITVFSTVNNYKESKDKLNKCIIEQFKNTNIGDSFFIGTYEQDNNLSNGKEIIEWLAIDKRDNKLFVISKNSIDCVPYHTTKEDVTWETSTLRKWLNNEFIISTFSEKEEELISTAVVPADKNDKYKFYTDPGNTTQDKVFLLSINEVEKYFPTQESRQCQGTKYAIETKNNGYLDVYWQLRTPGETQDQKAHVTHTGHIIYSGYYVDVGYGIRPAMWIDLSKIK